MLSDMCDITNKKQTKITKYFKKNEKQKETKKKRSVMNGIFKHLMIYYIKIIIGVDDN
jgi:hypothetical protein